jgi:ABC transporter DrrB family efflux protein
MSALALAVSDGVTMTWRNTVKNRRNVDVVLFSTAVPIAFALLFAFVFGSAIDVPGSDYREYLIVGILAQTMLMTASNTGVAIAEDVKKGLVDRFRSLPAAPSAVLVGRTTSDAMVNVLVVVLMSVTGLLIGWRIRGSVLDAVIGYALLLAFAYAVSWVTAYVGLLARSPETISGTMFMVLLPLTFVSNAFVPTDGLPTVLRVIAEWSPVSALVAACRQQFGNVPPELPPAASLPMQHPVAATLVWTVLVLVVFVPLAVRRFARTAGR